MVDKNQIIELIKTNPQMTHEDLQGQAVQAGISVELFEEAWKEVHGGIATGQTEQPAPTAEAQPELRRSPQGSTESFGPGAARYFLNSLLVAVIAFIPAYAFVRLMTVMFYRTITPRLDGIFTIKEFKFTQATPFYQLVDGVLQQTEPWEMGAVNFLYESGMALQALLVFVISLLISLLLLKLLNLNFNKAYLKQNNISKGRLLIYWLIIFPLIAGIVMVPLGPVIGSFVFFFLLFIYWHPKGVWGDLLKFSKEKANRQSHYHLKNFLIPILFFTILAAVHFALFIWMPDYMERNNPMFLVPTSHSDNLYVIFKKYILAGMLSPIISFTTVYALGRAKSDMKRILSLFTIPILLLIVFLTIPYQIHAYVGENYVDNKDQDLSEATGIPKEKDEIKERAIYLKGGKSYAVGLYDKCGSRTRLDCSKDSYVKALDYWAKNQGKTVYSEELYNLITSTSLYQWDLDAYFSFLEDNTHQLVLLENMITLSDIIKFSQLHDKAISVLDKYNNPEYFYLTSGGAYRLGQTYLHFGEAEKAQSLFDKAKEMGYELREQFDQSFTAEIDDDFVGQGAVSGQLTINNKPASNLKLGLIPFIYIKGGEDIGKEEEQFGESPEWLIKRPMAIATTDENGYFEFNQMLSGDYNLLIRGNIEQINEVKNVKFDFDKITINKAQPKADLNLINIVTAGAEKEAEEEVED